MSKYDAAQWSSVPGRPSFEASGYNSVAVVPLIVKRNGEPNKNHSEKSFQYLMASLSSFAEGNSSFLTPPNSPNPTRGPSPTPSNLEDGGGASNFSGSSSSSHANMDSNSSVTNSGGTYDESNNAMIDAENSNDAHNISSSSHHPKPKCSEYTWREELRECVLVIPNSHLTRPGDWRYDVTPLACFDWGKGCQRIKFFDGRPDKSRMAHDRIINKTISDQWGDLLPSRSTSAVVGVLNCKDCQDTEALLHAQEELIQWAKVYYHTPYEGINGDVSGGGMDHHPNQLILHRMFVFDSFDERCQSDLDFTSTNLGSNLVAFPPADGHHANMMDQHLNVVVNDLAVAIFRNNENKIAQVDDLAKNNGNFFKFNFPTITSSSSSSSAINLPLSGTILNKTSSSSSVLEQDANSNDTSTTTTSQGSLSESNTNNSANNKRFAIKTVMDRALKSTTAAYSSNNNNNNNSSTGQYQTVPHFLFTPLDDIPYDYTKLAQKDIEAIKKQQLGRREKIAGDYCLLAGSPLDAYERFSRAMEIAKGSHDPLWYAASIEGCATAYIAMADAGGHSVDEYLDSHFKLPEEVIALATSNPNNLDSKKNAMIDRTKTTLPANIVTLVEEALGIYCRHPKLAGLYAELLLKLSAYTADKEEYHMHCQWGAGQGCYGGDTSSGGHSRWENSLKTHLALGALGSKGKEYSLSTSLLRCQRCADLLQRAVSAGAIDPRTRADVAVMAARICLKGVKASHWGDFNNTTQPRLRLPRKAAFLTMIAAEAMTQCASIDFLQKQRATSLWLAASHLYARDGNGVAGSGNYGWATLRASALHGLSQMNNHIASEQAAELLILLLSEISPDEPDTSKLMNTIDDDNIELPLESNHSSGMDVESKISDIGIGLDLNRTTDAEAREKLKSSRKPPTKTITTKNAFFVQISPSTFFLEQSKWLEDEPIPDVALPLFDSGEALFDALTSEKEKEQSSQYLVPTDAGIQSPTSTLSLNCIVPHVQFETCANAQIQYISNLVDLRMRMPTSSFENSAQFSIYGPQKNSKNGNACVPPPVHVISASMIKSESNLLLERTKAAGYSGKVESASMATFFNPYDNKRKEVEKKPNQITLVAEGEERTVVILFSNILSVPLVVPSCQLEFDHGSDKIEAPPLSFTIPPKSKDFAVRFPFIILASQLLNSGRDEKKKTIYDGESNIFELIGVRITCMNRPYFITFRNIEKGEAISMDAQIHQQLPEAASVYPLSTHHKKTKKEEEVSVKVESVPAQPNLLVSFTTSLTPMHDNATVPVHLSDGEIYTIPPFRLENDFGSSGFGKMERLQIICVGLPGLQDEILFDTDKEAAARGEDVFLDSESDAGTTGDDFDELMECDGLPPLKMKAITEGLSLESINEKSKSQEGSVVTFQIAATHDMGNSLANGGHVRIRFRYRGPSPNPATEIWRRREISLRILRVKGPRISSLSFRSDLSWGSVFSELSLALANQNRQRLSQPMMQMRKKSVIPTEIPLVIGLDEDRMVDEPINDMFILDRIGMDQGVHISGDEVVVLMAVANETSDTIVLSNRKGRVGGFEASPMSTVRVTSGVSVKIPVVIQRIDRRDEDGDIADIAAELIARTALQWESEVNEGEEKENKRVRNGRVRIPSRCLREIIGEHQSFASRICESPVTINIDIGRKGTESAAQIFPGLFIGASMLVNIRDWIPEEVISKCTLVFEFCCAKKDSSAPNYDDDSDPAFIWCGQIRRIVRGSENLKQSLSHRARISFVQSGTYVVSACVKITAEGHSGEEIWWAPRAETVVVMKRTQ